MKTPQLFVALPEYICTPDSMDIDRHGNLVLSCPNFAEITSSGCVVKIDKDRRVTKWFDVPVHPETGVARNMGIALHENHVYLCDNQGWSGAPQLQNKGRMMCVTVDDAGNIAEWHNVATGMEHPNGVRIRNGYLYVTQSMCSPVKHPSGKLLSCVYRFGLEERDIAITNTLEDKHIFATFITENPDCQYGADGIAFDKQGNMYVGNFGDGHVIKILVDEKGDYISQESYARDPAQLQTTDGMLFDEDGNLYIADFSANAIAKVYPDGRVERLAQSPDCDGLDGGLDQPGEPILWNGLLVASCFDLVTGPDKVNTAHEMPATLACFPL